MNTKIFKKGNKILNISLIVLKDICLALLITLVFAFVFGYKFLNIQTGSMTPTMPVNTVVVIKKIPIEKVKVNDVVTYKTNGGTFITHRVVEVNTEDGIKLVTKGDASTTNDFSMTVSKPNTARQNEYVGTVQFYFKGLGAILNFIKTNILMIVVCIVLIMFVITYSY